MSPALAAWFFDTMLYTGALMAAVLLVRRPVSRWFGPRFAYALWALPLLRLLLPPIVLPAALAPAGAMLASASGPGPAQALWQSDAGHALLLVWGLGAALFLGWRIAQYGRARRDVLRRAQAVGALGRLRVVSTPAVAAPVAFGVLDPVVAVPPGFMALADRAARDLALAHEAAHHEGGDLLANMAAQVLLALHWFNPIAWIAWRAMRRDQEAACDARVLRGKDPAERARYGALIAGFASGRPAGGALPALACPLLAEKAIVERLRALSVAAPSPARQRLGLAALALAVMALPLTASIRFAEPLSAGARPSAAPALPATMQATARADGAAPAAAVAAPAARAAPPHADAAGLSRPMARHAARPVLAVGAVEPSGAQGDGAEMLAEPVIAAASPVRAPALPAAATGGNALLVLVATRRTVAVDAAGDAVSVPALQVDTLQIEVYALDWPLAPPEAVPDLPPKPPARAIVT